MSIQRDLDRAFRTKVLEGIDKTTKGIAVRAYQAVTSATPVGDPRLWKNPNSAPPGYVGGHARRNWIMDVDNPDIGEREGTEDVTAQETAKAQRFTIERNKRMVIHNSAPYIRRLNDGHSEQARPAGFVDRAVQAAASRFAR